MAGSFLTDDISSLLVTTDFAIQLMFTPSGGTSTIVNGVFDDEDVEVDHGDSRFIQRSAKLTCASSSVDGIAKDDVFQDIGLEDRGSVAAASTEDVDQGSIGNPVDSIENYGTLSVVEYTVAFFKDDGTGMVEIYMEAA